MKAAQFLQNDQMVALIDRTEHKLFASLVVMLSEDDAREVIQESYLRVFLELQNQAIDNVDGYLFRTARNLAISLIRKSTVASDYVQSHSVLQALPTPDDNEMLNNAIDAERNEALLQAIDQLPQGCQKVFRMRKLQGLTHKEIAAALDISVKTVENHLVRGMRLCREHLISRQATAESEVSSA